MPWEASSYTERSPHLGSDSPHPPTGSAHADHPRRKYLLVQLSTALGPPVSPDPTRNGHSFPSCRRPTVTRRGSPGPGLPSRPWTARSGPRHMSQPPPPARALDRAPASVLEVRASDTVFQAQSDQRQPQRGLVEHGPCKRILTRARRPDHNLTIERTSTLKDSDRRGENFLTAKGNRSSLNQKSGRSLAPGSSQVT